MPGPARETQECKAGDAWVARGGNPSVGGRGREGAPFRAARRSRRADATLGHAEADGGGGAPFSRFLSLSLSLSLSLFLSLSLSLSLFLSPSLPSFLRPSVRPSSSPPLFLHSETYRLGATRPSACLGRGPSPREARRHPVGERIESTPLLWFAILSHAGLVRAALPLPPGARGGGSPLLAGDGRPCPPLGTHPLPPPQAVSLAPLLPACIRRVGCSDGETPSGQAWRPWCRHGAPGAGLAPLVQAWRSLKAAGHPVQATGLAQLVHRQAWH
jgi:hypothetical protein